MKRYTIPAVVLGFIVISMLAARPALTGQPDENKSDEQRSLAQLRKERIEIYEKIVPIILEQYRSGIAAFSDYANAQEDLINAKLEATEKPSERITLLEDELKLAKKSADMIEQAHQAGAQVTEADALRAKAHCLTIEIRLAKERGNEKPAE
jgi:outer membrane protein TolC